MKTYRDIFKAIEAKNVVAVKALLPAQLNLRDMGGRTPLHHACLWGNIDIVRLLLSYGANIEAKTNDGSTPLHWLCECGYDRLEILELLVKRGADPFALNNIEKAAIDYDMFIVKDKDGNEIPHKEIIIQLRAEYLNKHALEASERTGALSSGWEMEI